jgi:hypothetical protein
MYAYMFGLVEQFKIMATTRLIPERDRRQSEIALLQDFMRLILLVNLFCSCGASLRKNIGSV